MLKALTRCLLVVVVLAFAAGQAGAQSREEVEAFGLYKEAKESMDALRFQEAIRKLEQAFAIYPLPQILAREAECWEKMGEMERALELYRKVKTDDPKLRGKVEKSINDLVFELNKPVELSVVTNTNDVEVTVDHVEKFRAPCTIKVTRGSHTFEFRKPGFAVLTEEKNVRGAAAQIYKVNLMEQLGRVILLTDLSNFDGMVVRLDDREMVPVGTEKFGSQTAPINVRSGTHSLLCVKEGAPPYMTTFVVAPDTTVEVTCRMRPPSSPHILHPAASWSMVGAGAALTGVGTWLVVAYIQDKQAYDDDQSSPNPQYKPGGFSSNKHYIGAVLLATGVAAAATGSGFLIRDALAKPRGDVAPISWGVGVGPVRGGATAAAYVAF